MRKSGERRRTQAVLEESLAHNELLLRELHHRVKNNIQMLAGLFSAAQREAHSEEVRGFLAGANARLMAIGAAQQAWYKSENLKAVAAAPFLTALCDAIRATLGPEVRLDVTADEVDLSNEHGFPPGADHQRACHERIQAWLGWGRRAGYGLAARRCPETVTRAAVEQWTRVSRPTPGSWPPFIGARWAVRGPCRPRSALPS